MLVVVKAVDVLLESRKQLLLSHIFTHFVKLNSEKSIFEMNQNQLQSATDGLSIYLEQGMVLNDEQLDKLAIVRNLKHKFK